MMRLASSVLAVGLAVAHAEDAAATCPPADFDTIASFDLDSFIAKRWWAQQQMEVVYLPKSQNRCVFADYSKRAPGLLGYEVAVDNHAEDVAPPHKMHDSGKSLLCAKIVDQARGKLAVAPCFLPSFFAGPYWIIDYSEEEGYAIISGGAPTKRSAGGCSTGTGVNDSGFWIFTRQQKRDQALLDKARAIAAKKGFDLSMLNDVDQSECTEDSFQQAAFLM
mmetsp:Transcript_148544/g.476988  ORF Transcript_148544/g.476988 Transcript_148544/m.476988 type:complete len:221 (+) Transcript_148544:78-740(+)